MGTTWRNLGSATRTKMRIDSSILSSLLSSLDVCCGVIADRIARTSSTGRRYRKEAGLAVVLRLALAAGRARRGLRRIGGRWSRVFLSFDTRRNLSRAAP